MQIDFRTIPVYFINLKEQVERKQKIIFELSKAGFKNIHHIEGVRHTTPHIGVSLSHLKALRLAESQGFPFIIFEDDVSINNFSSPILDIPDDCDIFYLGVAKSGSCSECGGLSMATGAKYEQYNDYLYKAISLFCDHGKAYFTKKSVDAQKRMIKNSLMTRMQHDVYMWKECKDLLCLTTRYPVVYQNDPDPSKKLWKRDETIIDVKEYIQDGRMEICDECNAKR